MPLFRDGKRLTDLASPSGRRVTHLIRDGKTFYRAAGGRETVQITLGTGNQARDQFRAALADRGMSHTTVTEIPFDIELVGTGSTGNMFTGCSSLTTVPAMDTRSVTTMGYMFYYCSALTHVPDLDTSQVTFMYSMFNNCSSLTDGNVRLIGKHPNVNTTSMITDSGLTRLPFYDTDGNPI